MLMDTPAYIVGRVTITDWDAYREYMKRTPKIIEQFENVVVPEMNMGQLSLILRAKYVRDIRGINKVKGKPFTEAELIAAFTEALGEEA